MLPPRHGRQPNAPYATFESSITHLEESANCPFCFHELTDAIAEASATMIDMRVWECYFKSNLKVGHNCTNIKYRLPKYQLQIMCDSHVIVIIFLEISSMLYCLVKTLLVYLFNICFKLLVF